MHQNNIHHEYRHLKKIGDNIATKAFGEPGHQIYNQLVREVEHSPLGLSINETRKETQDLLNKTNKFLTNKELRDLVS